MDSSPNQDFFRLADTAVNDFSLENLCDQENGLKEPLRFGYKKRFNTACWVFSKGRHYIWLGYNCLSIADKCTSDQQKKNFLRALLRHERAHGLYTFKNLRLINTLLGEVPFKIWNIVEDAYIEHAERLASGELFNWQLYHSIDPVSCPYSLLFNCIYFEGDLSKINYGSLPSGDVAYVSSFYKEVVKCHRWEARIALAKKFYLKYGEPSGKSSFKDDLSDSLFMFDNPDFLDIEDIDQHIKDSKPSSVGSMKELPSAQHAQPNELSWDDCKKYALELHELFKVRKKWTNTENPDKYLDMSALLKGDTHIYKKRVKTKEIRERVELLVDLSGSMSEKPSQGAREFLRIMSNLCALNSRLNVSVTLTHGGGYFRYKMPLSDTEIKKVEGFSGSEGIRFAIDSLEKELRGATKVYVYTDGNLTDGDVSKALMREKGLKVVGLYVGEDSASADMLQWFSAYINASSTKQLISKILASFLS